MGPANVSFTLIAQTLLAQYIYAYYPYDQLLLKIKLVELSS